MTDLTANLSRNFRSRAHTIALPSTNAEEYYVGAAVGLNVNTGRAVAISTSTTEFVRFVGWCEKRVTGDGTNTVACRIDGAVIDNATVANASAATDVGKLVYMLDDQTFTLSRPSTDAVPVGIVSRWRGSTSCDVLTFTIGESMAFHAAAPKRTIWLGSVGLRNTAANDVVCKKPLWGHGKIVKFWSYTARKCANGSYGAGTFELLLGSTSLGQLALSTSNSVSGVGGFVSGTSTNSLASRFSDGDLLTVKLKTATTAWSSSGAVNFYVDVLPA